MVATFDRLGISFQYPENWTLDDSDARQGVRAVAVYSPGGAFWSVMVHPTDAALHELLDSALAAMREEYAELESEPVTENIGGYESRGYDMNFYYLDLTSTARVRAIETPEAKLVVFCQADDTELAAVERVFAAMTVSLLRGLAA